MALEACDQSSDREPLNGWKGDLAELCILLFADFFSLLRSPLLLWRCMIVIIIEIPGGAARRRSTRLEFLLPANITKQGGPE